MPVEYLDPEIANEGSHADAPIPNAMWMNAPDSSDEEYQPEMDPPHINDYAAFKKHKHYKQYFRPWRYIPFPAWLYHKTKEPVIVKTKEEAEALGPDWRREPFVKKMDMTGKSLPVKSDTQRLAEVVASSLAHKQGQTIDATAIAAVVAAVMAALPGHGTASAVEAKPVPQPDPSAGLREFVENPPAVEYQAPNHGDIERKAMIELAEREGVKIDKRWSNDRIREALGIAVPEQG